MIRVGSQLVDVRLPFVMGILNATPDSFATHCNSLEEVDVLRAFLQLVDEGADWVDVGACSTRPGGVLVSEEEEMRRLDVVLPIICQKKSDVVLSVDTFRATVAEHVIKTYGVEIINDVSCGSDDQMAEVIARYHVPYICTYSDVWDETALCRIAHQVDRLHRAGVSDVIVDPGLGFGKTLQDNYRCLHQIGLLKKLGCEVLVGLSRKSMLYKVLDITPEQALNATTAAHMLALINGADILRVHDVKETKETIRIWKEYGR